MRMKRMGISSKVLEFPDLGRAKPWGLGDWIIPAQRAEWHSVAVDILALFGQPERRGHVSDFVGFLKQAEFPHLCGISVMKWPIAGVQHGAVPHSGRVFSVSVLLISKRITWPIGSDAVAATTSPSRVPSGSSPLKGS